MCFAPQRRALFQHLNFQKWSEPECVLYILTWKCASRHNGVQFFISHLASWLRTRRFSEPTFRPTGATNHWKNTVFRDFPTFSRICIFFLLILSLLTLLTSAFQLSILSEVSLLNFLDRFPYELVLPNDGSRITYFVSNPPGYFEWLEPFPFVPSSRRPVVLVRPLQCPSIAQSFGDDLVNSPRNRLKMMRIPRHSFGYEPFLTMVI